MPKKHQTGYKKKRKSKKQRFRKGYVAGLLVHNSKNQAKMSIGERIIKFLIYIALRLVIKPSKWKYPEKNYEIINRTYKRLMSPDFIFIPSSIAFYFVMGVMPIISLILFMTTIPGINQVVDRDSLSIVLGRFIPGIDGVLSQINSLEISSGKEIGGIIVILSFLLISAWIASAGFSKLIYTQSYIYKYKFVGGYWMNRIKGLFMVLGIAVGMILALIVNIYVTDWIKSWNLPEATTDAFTYLFLVCGLLTLTFLGFLALFRLSPRFKIRVKHLVPGAMVAALPTSLFLTFFGAITSLWSYKNYGSIGIIMYFGMSSVLISTFLFTGLIANAAYFSTFVREPLMKKHTLSKK